jgi:hypothetical protein
MMKTRILKDKKEAILTALEGKHVVACDVFQRTVLDVRNCAINEFDDDEDVFYVQIEREDEHHA